MRVDRLCTSRRSVGEPVGEAEVGEVPWNSIDISTAAPPGCVRTCASSSSAAIHEEPELPRCVREVRNLPMKRFAIYR
jgi:hypothetical protein